MKKLLLLPLLLISTALSAQWNMQSQNNQTLTAAQGVCGSTFQEDPSGDYSNNAYYTVTICAPAGQVVEINFTSFNLESGWDYLYVYDGNSASATQIGSYSGNLGTLTIESSGQCITLRFDSDGSVVRPGFEGVVNCIVPETCTDGIQNQDETGLDCGGCNCAPCNATGGSGATLTAGANNTTLPCGGGNVNLTATGTAGIPVLNNNFNGGCAGPGWNVSPAGQFNNPCGPGPNGDHMWMGQTTAAPRTLETAPLDVSCGGDICFSLKYATQGAAAPCEGPDLPNEGVTLQYNTGSGWVSIAYFHPNGTILTSNPGGSSPSVSGATAFTSWDQYCFTIPPAAQTAGTVFQWFQSGSSGTCCDHWGIDEVSITAQSCSPYYYDWTHIPGSPDAADVTSFFNTDTTVCVHYTNGINDTVTECFNITVDGPPIPSVTVTPETCLGDNDATALVDIGAGSNPNYTYDLVSGPAITGPDPIGPTPNTSVTFTGMPPGNYCVDVTDNGGCTSQECFTVTAGIPCCTTTASFTDPSCNSANAPCDGTATANPSGGVPPYSYQWYDGPNTGSPAHPGGTTQSIGSLCGGTYTVEITDATGCTSVATVTLAEPTAVTLNLSTTDVTCNGLADGTITATGAGGTGSFTYSDDGTTFAAGNVFTVGAGNYLIYVQDGNGCEATANATITEPSPIVVVEVANSNASCGQADGSFDVDGSGGPAGGLNYTLLPSGPTNSTGVFTGLFAGNYTVEVSSATNPACLETINVTIVEDAAPVLTVDNYSDVSCFGGINGSLTVAVTPGTGIAPYQYSIDGGVTYQASNTFTLLPAGNYCVDVMDANGCTAQTCQTISSPTQVSYTTVITDVTCNGICDGQVEVTASGGTAPYEFSLNNGVTFQAFAANPHTITGLCAGITDLVIRDASGCLANSQETINEPTPVVAAVVTTDASCGGYNDAILDASSSSGGTPGYTYSFDDGATYGPSATHNDFAGTYDVWVMDANGCTDQIQVTVGEPTPIVISEDANVNSTCGQANGSFDVSATGGTPQYVFTSTGGLTGSGGPVTSWQFANVAAGTYTVTVTDANLCVNTLDVTVVDESSPSILLTQSTDPLCPSSCDGEIIVNATNGTIPFQFNIDGGAYQASGTFGSLCAGTYTMGVQDANGCTSSMPITLNDPPAPSGSTVVTDASCFGVCDGEIEVTFAGGTGPYVGATDAFTFVPMAAGSPHTFTGLCAGTYDVEIQDANGCVIFTQPTAVNEPTEIQITENIGNTNCGLNNGQIFLDASGGNGPYTYALDPNGILGGPFAPSAPPSLWFNMSAASYEAVITDADGCSVTYFANVGSDIAPSIDAVDWDTLACFGDCTAGLELTLSGGTGPIVVNINGSPYLPTSQFTNLCAGTYVVGVQDDNACPDFVTVEIIEPSQLNMSTATTDNVCNGDALGQIDVLATGGTSPYNYFYDGNPGTNSLGGLSAGTYLVEVVDDSGCVVSQNVDILEPPVLSIDAVTTVDALCFGDNNGEIDMTVSGGTPGYLYSVDNGNTWFPSNVVTGQFAGTYNLVVEDANDCQATGVAVIGEPPLLSFTTALTPSTCGQNNGQIVVTESGGMANYLFSFDGGANYGASNTHTDFAGTYDVWVQDANGCTYDELVDIVDDGAPVITSVTGTDPSCVGSTDATLTVTATGVTANLFYDIGGAQQTNDGFFDQNSVGGAPGIGAGTVTITVTDDNGCVDTDTYTFTDPTPLTQVVNTTDLACNGDNSGIILVGGQGGTGAYQYSMDNCVTLDPAGTYFSLAAGTYDVCTVDGNGCSVTQSVTVNEPAPLGATYAVTDATCFGVCDGEIAVTASGGTSPYIYSADAGVTTQAGATIVSLCAGNQDMLVTDDNGCQVTSLEVVNEPTEVTVASVTTTETCDQANGTVTVNAAGGTVATDYTYDLSGTTQVANNLFDPVDDGSYVVTVTDDNGCSATENVTVVAEPLPQIDFVTTTDPLCAGSPDGEIQASASAGVGTIEYSLTATFPSGNTTGLFTGLTAGAYTVTIQDANGCQDTYNVTLTDPTALVIDNIVMTEVDCFGASTGGLDVTASGGTGAYTYSFDAGVTFGGANAISFVPAGTYDIVVQDANGCQATAQEVVTEPTQLAWDPVITITDNNCYGDSLGVIDAPVTGGVGPYDFNWSNALGSSTQSMVTNVPAGTYSLIVTDANGCQISDNALVVAEPPLVTINSVISDSVNCYGEANGIITIDAPNATSFTIDNGSGALTSGAGLFDGETGQNFDGQIPAGNYYVEVSDANGCTATSNTTVYQPDTLILTTVQQHYPCYNTPLNLSAFATGGNGIYTYNWSTLGTGPSQTVTETAYTTYTVDVVDQYGCADGPLLVEIFVIPQLQFDAIVGDLDICPGESTTLTASAVDGVTPYYMYWDNAADTSATTVVTPNGPVTQYTVEIKDGCGDTLLRTVEVLWHTDPGIILDGVEDGCVSHTVTLANLSAGSLNGNCLWTIEGAQYTGCDTVVHTFSQPGVYDVSLAYVTADGCPFDTTFSQIIEVYDNPEASFLFSPTVVTTLNNEVQFTNASMGANGYTWTFGGLGQSNEENPLFAFPDDQAGAYMVCLTAQNGFGGTVCVDSLCQLIPVEDEFTIYVPNVFTPDGDNFNETFKPYLNGFDEMNYTLYIFNRWGELLFESHNEDIGWDGRYLGEVVKQDVYVWKIVVRDNVTDERRTFHGHVSVLR